MKNMNRRVLLDINIILDFTLKRKGFVCAEKVFRLIFDGQINAFLPSSALPTLAYFLERETRKQTDVKIDWRSGLKTILSYIHVFSVTGQDVTSALTKNGDFEDQLMVASAMRIDSDMIALTHDHRYSQSLQTMTPQQFIQRSASQLNTTPVAIPLLNLPREYHLMMEEIDHVLLSVAASSQFIMGPQVAEFENKCAEYIGSKHAIGISSGTDSLVLALRALAIQGKGEEFFDPVDLIITTPFTFTATGDAILRAGANPLFVDVEPDGFNLDTENLANLIATGQLDPERVVGILPVHLFGHSCEMRQISELAHKYNWFVLEDAAQAFGAKWQEQTVGSLGTMGAFSFFPTKNLGGFGDGGLITTDDDQLNQLCRMLLRHGGKDKYNVDHIGYNARLDTLQAAVLLVRLKYLDQFNQKRREIAQTYNQSFADTQAIQTPFCCDDGYDVFHQYTVRLTNEVRDSVQERLNQAGVSSAIYYPIPLHKMEVFEGRSQVAGDLSNAESLCGQVLSLPIEPLMTASELKHITNSLLEACAT